MKWVPVFTEETSAVVRMDEATQALEEAITVVEQAGRADLVPGLKQVRQELQRLYKTDAKRTRRAVDADKAVAEAQQLLADGKRSRNDVAAEIERRYPHVKRSTLQRRLKKKI